MPTNVRMYAHRTLWQGTCGATENLVMQLGYCKHLRRARWEPRHMQEKILFIRGVTFSLSSPWFFTFFCLDLPSHQHLSLNRNSANSISRRTQSTFTLATFPRTPQTQTTPSTKQYWVQAWDSKLAATAASSISDTWRYQSLFYYDRVICSYYLLCWSFFPNFASYSWIISFGCICFLVRVGSPELFWLWIPPHISTNHRSMGSRHQIYEQASHQYVRAQIPENRFIHWALNIKPYWFLCAFFKNACTPNCTCFENCWIKHAHALK